MAPPPYRIRSSQRASASPSAPRVFDRRESERIELVAPIHTTQLADEIGIILSTSRGVLAPTLSQHVARYAFAYHRDVDTSPRSGRSRLNIEGPFVLSVVQRLPARVIMHSQGRGQGQASNNV